MAEKRDYNKESVDNTRKYTYGFDYEVMHAYMIKSFSEYYVAGTALELGSYQGAFTKRLVAHFSDITCVEASSNAIALAQAKPELRGVKYVESMFEDASLNGKFDNIFLTHVLEHVDDRVGLLRKVKTEWLSENGVFFVACPNAHAPSRQIAVKMGLIEAPEAVTPAEHEHGHRVTYTLETLGRDIEAAGLTVRHKSGIFFKALANFQWDMLLGSDVISQGYLDGCYDLGKDYPDLCSSIFFVCTK